MNQYPLLGKVLIVGFLMIALSVPLAMVYDLVIERSRTREAAVQDIARAHAGAQTIVGPVLFVPYTETYPTTVPVPGDAALTRVEMVTKEHVSIQFPALLETRGRLDTETRMRGIFPVTVYTSRHEARGRFVFEDIVPRMKDGQIALGDPLVLMGVSDLRGLMRAPQLRIGSNTMALRQAPAGMKTPLPLAAPLSREQFKPKAALEFQLDYDLAGTGAIGWTPLADETIVTLESSWPHPSFGGSFLPRTRQVTSQGFEATWSVPSLSSTAQQQFLGQRGQGQTLETFDVRLQDPVDVYRLTERATKYGLMFVVLTFAAFFALEMVKRWRIHPMQYLMIGAALVLFFLLLLSLAEHAPFAWAYLAASAACIGLLGYYLRHVLGGWVPGLGMSGMLATLYGVLYGILISEDNALIMGSLLLFGVLAAIMIATRKLDWYNVMRAQPASDVNPATAASAPV